MRRVALTVMFMVLACSCGRQKPQGITEQSVLTGRISGSGNRAPAQAWVDVLEPDSSGTPKRFQVASDGAFTATASKIGVTRLSFAGALHNSFSVALLLEKPSQIRLDIRLAPYEWESKFEEIKVIGDFNEFSRDAGCVVMVKQPNGTYAAELANLAGDRMGYQLIGIVRGSTLPVPGPAYDDLVTDSNGGFVSRLTIRNGAVRIVFDPTSLPRSATGAGVNFADSNLEVARIAALDAEMRRRQEEYRQAAAQFRGFGGSMRDFRHDWSKDIARLKQQLERESNPTLRQMLWISLLDLKRMRAQEVDEVTARQALAEIPPDALIWELAPRSLPYDSFKLAGGYSSHSSYFQTVVNRHPSREVRAQTLEQAYGDALATRDLARAKEYYKRLTAEFTDLRSGQRVKSQSPPPELLPAK
jgi:hypothetical protein